MKLKKIASLMLAGIMAVSMLAGCKGAASSNTADPEVKPVDNSLSAYVNEKLDDELKNIVTFSSDSKLESALNKAASMVDENTLKTTSPTWISSGAIFESFGEMLDTNCDAISDFASTDKDSTAAFLYVVPGNFTEGGMKDQVVSMLKSDIVAAAKLPGANGAGTYRYTYTGKIAVVSVDSNNGDYSAYVVGIVIDQTAKKVTV